MFNNDNYLFLSLKFVLKHLIWNFKFHKYDKTRKNIFLLTSRRSGGTWIMQALSRTKNTKSVIEPFNYGFRDFINRRHYNNNILKNGFPRLNRDRKFVISFIKKVLFSNSIKSQEQWRISSSDFHFFTSRTVVKLHSPKIFLDDFQKVFPKEKFIYLVRNPIAQTLSILKLEMQSLDYLDWFLEDKEYVNRYLSSRQIAYIKSISAKGQRIDKLFLTWILENYPLLRNVEHNNLLLIKYEDLVSKKPEMIIKIEQYLGEELAHKDKFDQPSITSFNSKKMIQSQNQEEILNRWKKEVNRKKVILFQEMLDIFGITLYSYKDFLSIKE